MSDGPSRNGRALGTALALGIGLAASVLIAELLVRAVLGEQVKFPRHVVGAPWGLRVNEPNARYRHKSADVEISLRINGQGMRRDVDFPYQKPRGTKRIVSLGDSFTIGYEVEGDQTFSAVLERKLRAAGKRVEVLNAGVSGFSTAEELLYLRRELWRYDPDVVIVSYYGNDLVDNVRTGLFRLQESRLMPVSDRYVPGGSFGDFLNTNPVLSALSGYSDAFALVKERLSELAKQEMVERNELQVGAARVAGAGPVESGEERLAVAIFDELARETRAHGVPLVIQSIPSKQPEPLALVETFPPRFDRSQPGVHFLAAKEFLAPHLGHHLLYFENSHGHWTPLAQRLSGEGLAALILREGLAESARAAGSAAAP